MGRTNPVLGISSTRPQTGRDRLRTQQTSASISITNEIEPAIQQRLMIAPEFADLRQVTEFPATIKRIAKRGASAAITIAEDRGIISIRREISSQKAAIIGIGERWIKRQYEIEPAGITPLSDEFTKIRIAISEDIINHRAHDKIIPQVMKAIIAEWGTINGFTLGRDNAIAVAERKTRGLAKRYVSESIHIEDRTDEIGAVPSGDDSINAIIAREAILQIAEKAKLSDMDRYVVWYHIGADMTYTEIAILLNSISPEGKFTEECIKKRFQRAISRIRAIVAD